MGDDRDFGVENTQSFMHSQHTLIDFNLTNMPIQHLDVKSGEGEVRDFTTDDDIDRAEGINLNDDLIDILGDGQRQVYTKKE